MTVFTKMILTQFFVTKNRLLWIFLRKKLFLQAHKVILVIAMGIARLQLF
jgi:hypothetical protein